MEVRLSHFSFVRLFVTLCTIASQDPWSMGFSRQECWSGLLKESFGPRKENNSLKGPLLNHLTSEKTKHNFSSILMLQASCIYLGLVTPCPETYHPLHPPRRLITPCPTASVISAEEYSKYPA